MAIGITCPAAQVRDDYSGIVLYDGECFIVEKGKLDTSANGITEITIEGERYRTLLPMGKSVFTKMVWCRTQTVSGILLP